MTLASNGYEASNDWSIISGWIDSPP